MKTIYTSPISKYIIILFMSILNIWTMHLYFAFNGFIEHAPSIFSYFTNSCTVTIDVSIALFVFLLLSHGRLRTSTFLTYFSTLTWSFFNVFYGRFFHNYLTLSAMGQAEGLADEVVINSILSGFQWNDLYFLLSFLAFIIICVWYKTEEFQLSWRKVLCVLFIPAVSLSAIFLVYSIYHFSNPRTHGNMLLYNFNIRKYVTYPTKSRNTYPNDTYFNAGVVRTLSAELYEIIFPMELSNEQKKNIIKVYKRYSERSTKHEVNPQIKNVVFIMLESFMSVSSDLIVDGKRIIPFLDSLKHSNDTYYNGSVHSNITCGESGDGQFIYMTGILPLRSKYVVGEAKNNTFPYALPLLLKKHIGINYAEIIVPTPLFVWQQENMNKVYGLNHCYSKLQVRDNQGEDLTDEAVFRLARKTDKIKQQPFFSLILSISTHQPYKELVDSNFVLNDSTLPNGYKIYLNACHHVDTQIKTFFEYLIKEGVYENCLIVITSDHHAHLDALGMKGKISTDLPLYIVHGNIDKAKAYSGPCNQLDVYTTILDVLGICSEWRGLGYTLLNNNYHNSVSSSTYDISEQIIMSDFFNNIK